MAFPPFDFHNTVSRVRLDPVPKKHGTFLAVANMRFLLRNGQFERSFDVSLDFLPDCFCICFGANNSNPEVISIAAVVEPLVLSVEWITTGEFPSLLLELLNASLDCLKCFFVCLLSLHSRILSLETIDLIGKMDVVFVGFPPFSCIKLFFHRFHEQVQFVQDYICQDW